MKWFAVIVLVIVGVLAAFVAIEYLTVSIHALPTYIPGHHAAYPHHSERGHYHKRGAVAAVIALVAFVVAGFLALRIMRSNQANPQVGPASSDQLIASAPSDGGESAQG
jgi:uncharacterized membrane protein YidH (DUF202 family)